MCLSIPWLYVIQMIFFVQPSIKYNLLILHFAIAHWLVTCLLNSVVLYFGTLSHTHRFYFSLSILYISSCVRCRVIGWKNGNRLHLTACICLLFSKTHFSILPIKKPVNRFRNDLKWTLTGGTKTESTFMYIVIDKYWFNFFLVRSKTFLL